METENVSQNPRITRMKSIVWVVLIAAFLRLYKIADYMTFLGDEGRDVLIVKHILDGKFTFLGPTASVGGFFLGPIYYYFMAPFLWLFHLDPVGPAVMVALFGAATVLLIFWVARVFFNERVGICASLLYAISPLVIAYSRSSWNPNPMPFFSLLVILTAYKAVNATKPWKPLLLTGIFLGVAMQLHYLATFLAFFVGVFVFLTGKKQVESIIRKYFVVFLGFLVGFAPFLAFEIRHGFPNTMTVVRFIFGSTGDTGFAGEKFTSIIWDVFFRLFGRLVTKFPPPEQVAISQNNALIFWQYGTVFLGIFSAGLLFFQLWKAFKNSNKEKSQLLLLFLWLIFGVGLFGFYKKPIYDYYFGFLFPLPFLLVGNLIEKIFTSQRYFGKILAITLFVSLIWISLAGLPFRSPANKQKDQVKSIAEFVLEKTDGKPFNFALVAGQNSDHGYRYFFEIEENAPITIENVNNDPNRKTVTDQLLIVCEDTSCKPLGHPLWEIAGFGRAEIVGEWNFSLVKVFKLVHYKGEK